MRSGKILRAMTHDGSARVLLTDATGIVERAREIHDLSPMSTVCLGRLLVGASLIGSMMGEKQESLTVGIRTEGGRGSFLAVSDYYGNVRGYTDVPALPLRLHEDGTPDTGAALGAGLLYVVRDTGSGEPSQGMIPLQGGGIADDLAAYFADSEQIPTVCTLGVLFDEAAHVRAAGGALIQLLPSPDEGTVTALEATAAGLGKVTQRIAAGDGLTAIMADLMTGIPYDPFDEITTDYVCTCSRERMERGIRSLGREKIKEMLEEQKREGKPAALTAHCRFCGCDYTFDEASLTAGTDTDR